MPSAFDSVRGDTAADYIVEVNRRAETEEPGWKLQWKLRDIGELECVFVFERVHESSAGEPEKGFIAAKAE